MSKKLFFLTSFVLVLGLAAKVTNAMPLLQDPGPDGIVSVEAEHYDNKAPGQNGTGWEEVGPTHGFTGVLGMEVFDESMKATTYVEESARLDYEINFVKTGTHYVWILAYGPDGGSDSCHTGLDGEGIPSLFNLLGWNGDYEWNSDRSDTSEPPTFEITTTGVHTFNVWMREDNLIVDKIVLTTNPNFTLTGAEPGPPESERAAEIIAFDPIPADGAIDVPRDIVLSWTAGAFADKHDMYFGTNFDEVNQATATVDPNGVYQGRIAPNIYTLPERLAFGETYYWRVDEVDAPPDNTIREGDLWIFTTEPFAYAIENITATASSSNAEEEGPENTINGSGLDANDLHSAENTAMWLSGNEPLGAWIEYEFDKVYKLHQMWVWNYNTSIEPVIGFGIREATIEYSTNGTDYTTLGTTHEFAQAPGAAGYANNTTVDLSGVAAKYIRLTANSNWGGIVAQKALSEVRFFYIPVHAREPSPDSGATDVDVDVTLGFRAGREAVTHDVYLSTDEQAVIDGTVPVINVTEVSHGPLSLDLGKTYYWRVDEVNEAETPATWQGDLWDFRTQEYFVVDDFEDYDAYNQIWWAWHDGAGYASHPTLPANPGNGTGSMVGDETTGSYMEETIVHGGNQSMPVFYDNSILRYSEVEKTLTYPRDWTENGVSTLTIWFRGDAANAAETLYVVLNGSAVVTNGNPDAALVEEWTQWNIDLQTFGVNLANINTIGLGLGNRNNPVAGGSGMMYFDDIRLYPPVP